MKTVFIPFLLLIVGSANAQSIQVIYERKLNLGLDDRILVEHHLAVHPDNPNHLLLSGMYVGRKDSSDYKDFSIVSKDNGKTWSHLKIFSEPQGADPWAEIMPDGTAIYTVLGLENMFVFTSKDAGETWNKDSINLGKAFDHQTIVIDETQNIVYIVAIKGNDIYINKPLDKGAGFPNPQTFRFSNLNSNTMTPVVLSDSIVLIPFSTFQRNAVTADGKQKREQLIPPMQWLVPFDGKTNSFKPPMFISQACERGFPVLAVDKSNTKYKDRLYYVCSNQTNNEILFHYSPTKGKSWSTPAVIKNYHNQAKSVRNSFVGIPQVVVNNKGVVAIVWQDRTDDVNGLCQYLYFTSSLDGGLTFLKPVKVSTVSSCMENPKNFWAADRYKSGGDYLGFTAKPDGNFQVTWADSREGTSQLYMAEIKVE